MKKVKDFVSNFSDDFDFSIFLADGDCLTGLFLGTKLDLFNNSDLLEFFVFKQTYLFDLLTLIVVEE